MKKNVIKNTTKYLVISSAHLGMSEDILAVYGQVAKKYKAKVIHLGPLATDKEIKEYNTAQLKASECEIMLDSEALGKKKRNSLEAQIENFENIVFDIKSAQSNRMSMLEKHFGKVVYVTTDEMCVPTKFKNEVYKNGLELSKYLFLSPVMPRTVKATAGTISSVSLAYLNDLGKSWIVAHPVPEVQNFPKPGLNEAYNYYTVGCLKHAVIPTHTSNQYNYAHMPCAIFLVVDNNTGEFHSRQMHIDYLKKKRSDCGLSFVGQAVVLDDGFLFTESDVKEIGSDDKAVLSSDYHAKYQHPGVVGVHRALNMLHQPATIIDGGDTGDFGSVSHWNKGRPGISENHRLKDDLLAVRRLLDAIGNFPFVKNRILIDSNHHDWLTDFVNENPCLKGMLDWDTLAKEMFSDWEMIIRSAGENKLYWFGDLLIRHGDKDGGHKGRFKNIKHVCGHGHRYMAWRRSSQIGCGCMLGPEFTENEVNAWQNQLATITRYDGVTAYNPKTILHDKKRKVSRFAYRDSIYEVDHYFITPTRS